MWIKKTRWIHQSTRSNALRRSHNLDLHGGWRQCCQLLGHTLTNSCKHGGSTRKHNVGIEILTDVDIAFHNGLECGVVNAACLLADKARLEEDLRAAEALASDGDDVAIWKLVSLLLVRALRGLLHLSVEIQCNVGELLLDI